MVADQTRAIRKVRANTNKAYVNAKGQEVKPKEFDEEFICSCPKKCTDPKKLPLKTRRQIFNMFWNIGSYEGKFEAQDSSGSFSKSNKISIYKNERMKKF